MNKNNLDLEDAIINLESVKLLIRIVNDSNLPYNELQTAFILLGDLISDKIEAACKAFYGEQTT